MLAIFTVMVGVAATYPPEARFMPFIVGIPAIALCLLQLALDLYRRRAPGSRRRPATRSSRRRTRSRASPAAACSSTCRRRTRCSPRAPHDERERVRREIIVWGYFLGLIAGILLLGFRIAVPVFLIAFLRFQAGDELAQRAALWRRSARSRCIVLFEKVLQVSLHTGFLTDFFVARLVLLSAACARNFG